MRILIYTHEFIPSRGGVATYNNELAKGLSELGHEVIVLAPKYSNEDIIFDRKMPFHVVRVNLPINSVMHLNRNITKLLATVYRFLKVLWHHKPDRVLVTEAVAHECAALARLFYPFRFTLTVHGTEVYWHFLGGKVKRWPKSRLMHWFFHKAASIICVSSSTRKRLEQNTTGLGKKISVVHNGIDPSMFSLDNKSQNLLERFNLLNQKVILTVATLSASGGKGQDIVIRALPKVLQEIPNTKYLVVGDGPTRPELEKLVEDMGLGESVLFTGFVSREHVGSFYNICDVFVMLSRIAGGGTEESFGYVFLEALAHEKPVIGGSTGGVIELIEDGKTGLLVDPTDVNAAAEAMCRVLKNEDLAKSLGKAGRRKVQEVFSRESMAQKTLELL